MDERNKISKTIKYRRNLSTEWLQLQHAKNANMKLFHSHDDLYHCHVYRLASSVSQCFVVCSIWKPTCTLTVFCLTKNRLLSRNLSINRSYNQNKKVTITLRGYCTSHPKKAPKLACFVLYLKIINIFFEKYYMHLSKLSKELKGSIKIKIGQVDLELLIQKPTFWLFWSTCIT